MLPPNIGILGLGNRSTQYYLNGLNKRYNTRYGGFSTFPLIILNADFEKINPYLPDDFEKLKPIVSKYLDLLWQLKVQHIILPNITLHETVLQLNRSYPILDPLNLLKKELLRCGISEIFLFGSAYTMNSGFMIKYFSDAGVLVRQPETEDQKILDQVRQAVYHFSEAHGLIQSYIQVTDKYAAQHTVILACTELSIAYKLSRLQSSSVIDMVDLQMNEALLLYKSHHKNC